MWHIKRQTYLCISKFQLNTGRMVQRGLTDVQALKEHADIHVPSLDKSKRATALFDTISNETRK